MQGEISFSGALHGQRFQAAVFLGILILHIDAGVAVWYALMHGITFTAFILMVFYTIMRGIGISVGYHRLLTHRSFNTHSEFLRKFLFYWGGVGGQNTRTWRANHLDHHTYGDTEHDPYSPYWPYNGGWKGFWWAHMGALWHEYKPTEKACRFLADDLNKTAAEWEARYHIPIFLSGFLVPGLLAGWEGLLFAGFLSIVYVFHMTWAVNSVCHMWGHRDLQKSKRGTNNFFVILLGFVGEGFHLNHHADPRAAYLGPKWWHIDLGKWVIQFLEWIGLADGVRKPRVA